MMASKLAITIQKIFDGSLKILAQYSAMIIKTNIMLEVIRDWIENKTGNIFAPLYNITAYPHLENCPIQSTWQQYGGVPKSWEEWLEIQNSYHVRTACSSSFWKRKFQTKRNHQRGLYNLIQNQSDKWAETTSYFKWIWEL